MTRYLTHYSGGILGYLEWAYIRYKDDDMGMGIGYKGMNNSHVYQRNFEDSAKFTQWVEINAKLAEYLEGQTGPITGSQADAVFYMFMNSPEQVKTETPEQITTQDSDVDKAKNWRDDIFRDIFGV